MTGANHYLLILTLNVDGLNSSIKCIYNSWRVTNRNQHSWDVKKHCCVYLYSWIKDGYTMYLDIKMLDFLSLSIFTMSWLGRNDGLVTFVTIWPGRETRGWRRNLSARNKKITARSLALSVCAFLLLVTLPFKDIPLKQTKKIYCYCHISPF